MNFLKFTSIFFVTIILTLAINMSVAAFQNVEKLLKDGTTFSGAFQLNPTQINVCPVSRRTLEQLFFDFAVSSSEFQLWL
ncbi:hypothetical protein RIVM261_042610 [Rivularia sp. IAM M-261]|nr:hypothetical protein RIVM261_042610 [Rivularia sp. IAM M-261]